MERLKALLKSGKITQEEFDALVQELEAERKGAGTGDGTVSMTEEELEAMFTKRLDERFGEIEGKVNAAVDNKLKGRIPAGNSEQERLQAAAEKTVMIFRAILGVGDRKAVEYMNEATAADGGVLVPDEFMAEVMRLVPTYGVARRDCRVIPMMGKTKKVPRLLAGIPAYWIGEGSAKTAKKPTLDLITLTANKLAAIVPSTDELLEDASIDTFRFLADLCAEAFALEEDIALFTGNGGSIPGIVGTTGVAEKLVSGATFATMTPDDLFDMTTAIPSAARRGAKFYLHSTVLGLLAKKKETGTGAYVWQKPAEGRPGLIWNYPYEEVDHALPSTALSAGEQADTGFVVFGSLRNVFYGDRKQMTVDRSNQATVVAGEDSVHLWQNDMTAIRAVKRLDIKVAIPSALCVLKTTETS